MLSSRLLFAAALGAIALSTTACSLLTQPDPIKIAAEPLPVAKPAPAPAAAPAGGAANPAPAPPPGSGG